VGAQLKERLSCIAKSDNGISGISLGFENLDAVMLLLQAYNLYREILSSEDSFSCCICYWWFKDWLII